MGLLVLVGIHQQCGSDLNRVAMERPFVILLDLLILYVGTYIS